ncbi:MAG: alpha/beta hydrolase [Candidatus Dormibacteria bacterium]
MGAQQPLSEGGAAGPRLREGPPPGAPWRHPGEGRVEELVLESRFLEGNRLGDPHERPLWVYLPPAYEARAEGRFPVIYLLQGMSGQVDMWRARTGLRPTPLELFDALFSSPGVPPAILVLADCWTSLGGSQYLDSPATGQYHSYLCQEVVPAIDGRYRTLARHGARALAGKSSGGFGAMVTCLLRPDLFSAFASHAGDALFEYCYGPEFPQVVRSLRDEYQGSYQQFWEDFRARPALSRPSDSWLLNVYCMAACYSAEADGSITLPFEVETGVLRPEVWERWQAWDPVRMIPRRQEAARSLRGAYLDAGRRDEWHLDVGAAAVAAALNRAGQQRVHFELFDGGHLRVEYRYPLGLRHLLDLLDPAEIP